MKSCAVRLEAMCSWSALRQAWRSYRVGKRRRPKVARFELDADLKLLRLAHDLTGGRYRHGAYRLLRIRDPKPRLIAVAAVRDRVVHTAVYRGLAPFFNRSLIRDTYACLPGRGTLRAMWRFLEYMRRYPFLLHLDIQNYFAEVDHICLAGLIKPRLRDARVAGLVDEILRSGGQLYRRPEVRAFFRLPSAPEAVRTQGLPIGNLTSQWWGNLYLNGLDHFIKRNLGVRGYLRYQDDFVCFGERAKDLRQWRGEIGDWLWRERRLRLNRRKGQVRSTGLPQTFLGYRVRREGWDVAGKVYRRFRRRLPHLIEGDPERLYRSLAAWRGIFAR